MKNFILSSLLFIPCLAFGVTDLEVPLEMNAFQLEFSDISKTGIIRVKECNRCTKDIYSFTESIKIKRSGKVITLEVLLGEYSKVKYPTIFLDINSNNVVKISY
ncbi:MAG: hypothetical protein JXR04_08150 [Bermanella sp.]